MSYKVLIVDDDDSLRALLKLHIKNIVKDVELYESISGHDAIKKIKSLGHFNLVLSDFDMEDGDGSTLYNYCYSESSYDHFVLLTSRKSLSDTTLNNYPQNHNELYYNKPISYNLLKDIFSKIRGEEILHDTLYSKVSLSALLRFEEAICDIFIKLYEGKFIRVIATGNCYTRKELTKYQKRDEERFYVHLNDYEKLCQSLFKKPLLKLDPKTLYEEKVKAAHHCIHDIVLNVGISSGAVEQAKEMSQAIEKLVSEDDFLLQTLAKSREQLDYIYEHSYMTACICIAVEGRLEWSTKENAQKLTMAAIFHDLSF